MTVRILTGDCRTTLASLDAESVQMCVTSPPYFGLRDYGMDSQIGLEATPDAYVAELVAVFREVRRVLKDDGTLWCNLGDSYTGSAQSDGASSAKLNGPQNATQGVRIVKGGDGLKPKDLIGIPWRVAFALQADGWYLRSDIIWHKPNPMPESVTDRPTKSHEYLFLLAKSERYYYDADAIADEALNAGKVVTLGAKSMARSQLQGFGKEPWGNSAKDSITVAATRNKRTVWTIATQPFKGAHFATFPPALIEPCILAGSAKGDTVLDPFGGAGTTGLVADRLGRNAILCELNPDYAAMAERRIHGDAPLFAEVLP